VTVIEAETGRRSSALVSNDAQWDAWIGARDVRREQTGEEVDDEED